MQGPELVHERSEKAATRELACIAINAILRAHQNAPRNRPIVSRFLDPKDLFLFSERRSSNAGLSLSLVEPQELNIIECSWNPAILCNIYSCSSPVVFEPPKVSAEPAWQIRGFFMPALRAIWGSF